MSPLQNAILRLALSSLCVAFVASPAQAQRRKEPPMDTSKMYPAEPPKKFGDDLVLLTFRDAQQGMTCNLFIDTRATVIRHRRCWQYK
jgi:hypothetical protein